MSALISLSALSALGYVLWYRTTTRIEESTSKIEAAFDTPPQSRLVSGGPGSHVTFESMGREGRRHARTVLPASVIENVMGEPAKDPIRVFVGLDSAPSREERIRLALSEMERTGAFSRSLIIVASPTGTGYVNYVAIESAEYFTRGDCATVTVQYSKRPSPVSLDRVWLGRKQFRMLLSAIRRRLYKMPPDHSAAFRPLPVNPHEILKRRYSRVPSLPRSTRMMSPLSRFSSRRIERATSLSLATLVLALSAGAQSTQSSLSRAISLL